VPVGDHRRLHDLLVELRHRAGDPSLRKINSGCGVSVGYLSQIFTGKTAPGADVAVKVAQALKASEREQARIRFYAEGTETDRSAQRTADPARSRRLGWDGCPYLGLRPFEEHHAAIFYGRRALTGRLLDRLRNHPSDAGMLLVLGPSGAGKSSLLRAGLMGAVAGDSLAPGSQFWPRRVITPTGDPVRQLAIHLADLAATDAISVQQALIACPGQAHLLAGQALTVAGQQHSPAETASAAEPDTGDAGGGPRLVLVVDQLEELFTLTTDPSTQETFLTALHSLATEPMLPDGRPGALVIAGIRADFLGQALAFTPVRHSTEAGAFTVGAMSESELREAVTGPAAEAGVRIPDDLCTAILDDLREHSLPVGFDSGALPLLSQVMFVMWQAKDAAGLTVTGYRRTGGVADIVRTSADQVYNTLTPGQQDLARRAFTHLTATTDGRLTRRPSTRSALRTATNSDDIDAVIEAFAAQRLLTVGDSDTVTIAHEELLRSWTRLHDWLQPNLTDQALHRALTDDVHDWQQRHRDPSYLYQGGRLLAVDTAVGRWTSDPAHQFALDPATVGFLHASRRRARRRRRTYQGVAAVMVLLLALTSIAGVLANRNSAQAERERAIAVSRQLATQSIALLPHNSELAALLSVQAYRTSPTDEAVDSLRTAVSQPIARTLAGHTADVSVVAYSRDGGHLASAGYDQTVRVWDLGTGNSRTLTGHSEAVYSLAYSPDSRHLATAGSDQTVQVWDLSTGKSRTLIDDIGNVSAVVYSPDGKHLATASDDQTVRIWDLSTGKSRTLSGHTDRVSAVVYSPDGKHLATASDDQTVRIWDLSTGKSRSLSGHTDRVGTVAYSPDGKHLASGSNDKTVRVWNLDTGKSRSLSGHTDWVYTVAYSPDGRHLAGAGPDPAVRVWDLGTGEFRTLTGHSESVSTVAYSPDGRHLAGAGSDQAVRVWDLSTGKSRTLTGHSESVRAVAYSPDGRHLATAALDQTVRVWNLDTGASRTLIGQTGIVSAVAYSPDGRHLATAALDQTVRVWDLDTGEFRLLLAHTSGVSAVAYNPDGRHLATAALDKTVRIWDLDYGDPNVHGDVDQSRILTKSDEFVTAVTYGPDGRHLATAGDTVRVWDLDTGKSRTLTGHTDTVSAVAYSPDGRHLASGSNDKTVRVWNLDTGKSRTLTGHTDRVSAVAYSPDGQHLASAGETVRIWDLNTGQFRTLTGHTDRVSAVAYSLDGRDLASASFDKTVRVWANVGLMPAAAVDLICATLRRDLTSAERETYLPSADPAVRACA
jgi:WD40 repeat protein/transcriptional regulator with XRE-family HTH domain